MKKTLNGSWQFRRQGGEWKTATVPGCNFLDLIANSDIPDPFVGLNESKVGFVGESNWEYRRSFELTEEEFECDEVLLNCKMLDTICDVRLNGRLLFSGDNCFVGYSVPARELLTAGKNEIEIVFYSPVNYVKEKYSKCLTPRNSNGQNGIVHIRKPQCHFGWDWGPVLPCCGITKDIELEFVKSARIDYLGVCQSVVDSNGVIEASAQIAAYGDYECTLTLICPDGKKLKKSGESAKFIIENPELWWTYELSQSKKQPLYTVKAEIKANGKTVDTVSKKTGIRTVELNRSRDEYGQNFQFVLNGVPLFIKGANYIPPDSFITRFTPDRLDYLLEAVIFSNINMLRVWGGGYYESDEFYAACDEKGILVWQDFQFACQAYPFFDGEFLENVKREVEYNVKRLCAHPSLAVWNGNNEIEDMHMSWAHMRKYVDWTEKFFYHILEPEIRKYDKSTPYTPGSPIGKAHNEGVSADNVGDTHLWGVWHGLKPMDYYRTRMTRFCSEFGFESLPDIKAVGQYAQRRDWFLESDVMKAHQKCANGNDKMIYYIVSRFNLPVRFVDLIYLSQVTQNECIADATEHWRRNKGRCNGSMYWQLNDCWGVCSWSSLDYYGNYKALQYGARHFNAPLTVSAEDTKEGVRLFVLNDFDSDKIVDIEYELFDFEKGTLEKEKKSVFVQRVENICAFDLKIADIRHKYDLKKTGMAIRLYENESLLEQKTVLFDSEKKLALPKARLKTKIKILADELEITVGADRFARLVRVESSRSILPFSDNFFDILPGESKTVKIKKDPSMTLRDLAESINVFSLSDVRLSKNRLSAFMKQFKVFLSPVNISNAVYHGKPGTSVELD